jgi:GNAT superfamily N-acetyltransferase
MSVTLRQLQPGDNLDEATRLFTAYRQFYELPAEAASARTFLSMRLQAGQAIVYLAEDAGRAIGFMLLYPTFCSLALAPIWVLNDLYVPQDARGRGVAGTLLAQAERLGRERGAAYLMLSTAHSNFTAQRLYEAHGWQHDTVYRSYTLTLDVTA